MIEVNQLELEQLQSTGKKILVDFYATWCGPCKMLMPRLEIMSQNYPDVTFVKMDVDKNTDFAVKMGIRGVPTIMIYNGTELIDRSSGIMGDNHYSKFLN